MTGVASTGRDADGKGVGMLFTADALHGIKAGRITCAFRRWRRPTVQSGTQLRTPVGVVSIDSVRPIGLDEVTDDDARRAGFDDADTVRAWLADREGTPFRIDVAFAGADPRIELRQRSDLSDDDIAEVSASLARFDDSSRRGPWTTQVLDLIAGRPGVPASELAAHLDVDTPWLKRNVRKLKELGLTVSLRRGYRLSPRGEAFRNAAR